MHFWMRRMSPHVLTAVAYYAIAAVLLELSLRVWWTHPINRAFMFGPFMTPAGVKLMLRNWQLVFLFGAFILSCAVEHSLDGHTPHPQQLIAAWIEAAISLATAGVVLRLRWRAWRRR